MPGAAVLNQPLRVRRRYELLRRLHAAGLYHKYGAMRVGPAIVALELDFSRSWVAKDTEDALADADFAAREVDYIQRNPHAADVEAIVDLARIGFGRIDYAIKNGRLVTFEINTAPHLVPAMDGYGAAFAQGFDLAMQRLVAVIRNLDDRPAPVRLARVGRRPVPPHRASSFLWRTHMRLHGVLRTLGLLSLEPRIMAMLYR